MIAALCSAGEAIQAIEATIEAFLMCDITPRCSSQIIITCATVDES